MVSVPTPPKLLKTKVAAVTAAAMATTAALTLGVTSPVFQAQVFDPPAASVQDEPITADVDLAALVGLYGVGPVFWVAQALGVTPEDLVMTLVGQLDNPTVNALVGQLLALAGQGIDTGAPGPLPGGVYNAVNSLEYSSDFVLNLVPAAAQNVPLGLVTTTLIETLFDIDLTPFSSTVGDLLDGVVDKYPILSQRRAILLSEGLGGLSTSLAYRDMINAVTGDADDWEPGVTALWLAFLNNPSRPGGGIFSLATPFTTMFGVNLTTPAGGSYTNADTLGDDATKILNASVLDVTWAYNASSDAPTTLSPLAWLNAIAGAVFLTHLIPDGMNFAETNVFGLTDDLLAAAANAGLVLADPTGGLGTGAIPVIGDLIDALAQAGVNLPQLSLGQGTSYYLTYDSRNLPLLEPFDLIPRLLGLVGVNVPQPFVNSIERALRMAVNMGYQDVDPVTLERRFDMGGQQALLWHSPLTASQRVEARQTIANALVDDIQANLLNPVAWTPSFAGQTALNNLLKAVIQNQFAMTVSALINQGIDVVQAFANDIYDRLQVAFKPVLDRADGLGATIENTIDGALGVQNPESARSAGRSSARAADVLTRSISGSDVVTAEANSDRSDSEGPVAPKGAFDALEARDLLADNALAKNARAAADALKEQRQQVRAELDEAGAKIRTEVEKAGAAVDKAFDGVKSGIEKVGDSLKQSAEKAKEKRAEKEQRRTPKRELAAAG
ncbi:PE-PPE domain-containing protein [Mycobacterium sp. ACS4331]|uniref:PE-PPE domain-containing protein n=1 Tax=Mycobacterium sp. ACS4331 TaxID=1834121 RepID=UPI0008013C11|nr:PE-PPE domain-containing protein [Mycobacterium sp. ACS4331]OBF18416.1 hypothetical protein A5727_11070 [Mycobacterium sp. ACS4331]